jgi:hypothetical protein
MKYGSPISNEKLRLIITRPVPIVAALSVTPTSLPSTVILEVDDYESKHENKFQKIKAEPSDPACSLTIEY